MTRAVWFTDNDMTCFEKQVHMRFPAVVIAAILGLIVTVASWRSSSTLQPRIKQMKSCDRLWQEKMAKHDALMRGRRDITAWTAFDASKTAKTAYDPFEATYTCHSELRRGKLLGDGGKFVCGDPAYFKKATDERCLVYSVGSAGDETFEHDIISNLGCEVHTFDPTGNSTHFKHVLEGVGAHFHSIGVGGHTSTMANTVTGEAARILPILDIVKLLGHGRRDISMLKIDCEGCEYKAFDVLWHQVEAGLVSIGQIQIEMHGTNHDDINSFFEGSDRAGYMVFHKERNHWGCKGYECVEFSLIHRREAERMFRFTHCRD